MEQQIRKGRDRSTGLWTIVIEGDSEDIEVCFIDRDDAEMSFELLEKAMIFDVITGVGEVLDILNLSGRSSSLSSISYRPKK
jgi:hypothetical protein